MNNITRTVPDREATQPKKITWGTATLKFPAEIALHIPGVVPPIRIKLTQPLILGRASYDNDLDNLVDLTAYNAVACGVSRQHLQLEMVEETVRLTDLNSANGTYLNNQKLLAKKDYLVRNGDVIRLGCLSIHIYF